MSKTEIRCGDAGDGNECFCRYVFDWGMEEYGCYADGGPADDGDHVCHCPDARHSALLAQLGEAGVRRVVDEWLAANMEPGRSLHRPSDEVRMGRWVYARRAYATATAAVLGEEEGGCDGRIR